MAHNKLIGLAHFDDDGFWHIELVALSELERRKRKSNYPHHFTFNAGRRLEDVLFNLWQLMKYRYQIEPDTKGCYLMHFSERVGQARKQRTRRRGYKGHAQHYLGCSSDELIRRIVQHQSPNSSKGSRLTKEAKRLKIEVRCVRLWRGGFPLEKALKARKNNRQLCPHCRDDYNARRRSQRRTRRQNETLPQRRNAA